MNELIYELMDSIHSDPEPAVAAAQLMILIRETGRLRD